MFYVNNIEIKFQSNEDDQTFASKHPSTTDISQMSSLSVPEAIEIMVNMGKSRSRLVYPHIKHKIDHSKLGPRGQTFLMAMCENEYKDVAMSLIKEYKTVPDHREPLDLNLANTNTQGDTALIIACRKKLYDVAYDLITTNKSNPGQVNSAGETALMVMCGQKTSESSSPLDNVLSFLSGLARHLSNDASCGNHEGSCASNMSRHDQNSDILHYRVVRALIATGKANPGHTSSRGSALWLACTNKLPKAALAILASGEADPGFIHNGKTTSLMMACVNNMPSVAMKILETGEGRPEIIASSGGTALIAACEHNMTDVAMKILSIDQSNVNRIGSKNLTAIQHAVDNKMYKVAHIILDINARNRSPTAIVGYGNDDGIDRLNGDKKTMLDVLMSKISDNDDQLSLIVRLFLLTKRSEDVMKFFTSVKGGHEFLLRHSDQKLGTLLSTRYRSMFIDSKICQICQTFDPTTGYSHQCGVFFHTKCINSWLQHSLGEILSVKHLACPHCNGTLPLFEVFKIPGKIFISRSQIESLDPKKYWKACKTCKEIFDAGDRSCEDTASLSDRCTKCQMKIITCPGCGMMLEHNGGCSEFRCCLFGIDRCRRKESLGITCDHGSSKSITFCGHTWRISTDVMNPDTQSIVGTMAEVD